MYPEMWAEIQDLAEGKEGAPAMARELLRRGIRQAKAERGELMKQEAEIRKEEAIAQMYEEVPTMFSEWLQSQKPCD